MSGDTFPEKLLEENLRCRVIYYSCVNPSTIADLNQAWGYSPTYLYQENAIDRLEDSGIIEVEEDGGKKIIESSYDKLFVEGNIEKGMDNINQLILQEFLIHSKGFHPSRGAERDREDMLSMARGNLEEELEQNLVAMEFSWDDYSKLVTLWQNELFKETFFSLDILTALFGDRKDELPQNPLDHLFRLTAGIVNVIGRSREERGLMVPPGLTYRVEPIIVPAHRLLDKRRSDESDHSEFASRMNDVYSIFRSKFHEDRFNHDFLKDFSDLAMRRPRDRKFSDLFDKYRGSDRFTNPFS
ncbi:MAG: hypothetical protein MUP63_01750 [Candidatus Nanohaloarchaeota archaeon QJJ-7]|nr:hypothetical protein [Candidatus Nanohaloarchaeota archaeon QJJ-7]